MCVCVYVYGLVKASACVCRYLHVGVDVWVSNMGVDVWVSNGD